MPRPIDADALIAKAYIMQEPNGFIHSVVTERQIVKAPTIEAEPVKHGRWTKIDASYWQWKHDGAHSVKRIKYRHDECGKIVPKKENYCPNCGAKMDGGNDHD